MAFRSMLRWIPLCLLAACAAAPEASPRLLLPPRPASALTGSQLLAQIEDLSFADRERRVWDEFAKGNVPECVRELVPVTTTARVEGQLRTATFWCTPDYLGVGSGSDWFRMPMTPTLAQRLADHLGCSLPTRRMVDAIWSQAPLQLEPFPYHPLRYDIVSASLFHAHHVQIEQQREQKGFGGSQRPLTAGTKKDVVVSALLGEWPGRVVIYGWHRADGEPIQPLSKVHTFGHVDYSHGVRLVSQHVDVDGVAMTIGELLRHPVLHPLLSDEGPFSSARYEPAAEQASASGRR